jgi:glycosyltransferase involved in cell wall biosynthesis
MKAPIRVLHYGMSSNLGGIESFIINVYRNINRSKIQFDFLTFSSNIVFSEEIERLGGKVYRLSSRKESFFNHSRQLKDFFIEHQEFNNVHVHLNTCSYIEPIIAAARSGKGNIIAHSHNQWSGKNARVKIFHEFNKPKVTKYSNHLFACSNIAGEYMFGDDLVKNEKYKLVKNGIDSKLYKFNSLIRGEVRQQLNIKNKFVIGHIGRLSYQKNHKFILDIFSNVYKMNKEAVLLLIGNGELEKEIKAKIKILGLEKSVIMLGVRNDIPNLLQAMDVFLFPSHFEGFGIAALESQAAGLKTIVSESLPEDIKVTDLLEVISLERPASYWAKQILMHDMDYNDQREKYNKKIVNSGFDIMETVELLESCYLSKELKLSKEF